MQVAVLSEAKGKEKEEEEEAEKGEIYSIILVGLVVKSIVELGQRRFQSNSLHNEYKCGDIHFPNEFRSLCAKGFCTLYILICDNVLLKTLPVLYWDQAPRIVQPSRFGLLGSKTQPFWTKVSKRNFSTFAE